METASLHSISKVALSVLGFLLITGDVIMEERPNPVFLNGESFANAIKINGILVIPLEDFAKAAGGKVSLEPDFQLQGSTLTAKVAFQDLHVAKPMDKSSPQRADVFAKLGDIKGESLDRQRLFNIRRVGVISTNVLTKNGKAYLSLADVAKAFGNTSWQGAITLRPGESISLNFTTNANGILRVRQ